MMKSNSAWPLRILRWSYCAFIGWASWQTFVSAHAGNGHEIHALILSVIELIAILAFLIEPIELPAMIALCVVYLIATIITTLEGEMPIRFVFFAVTAAYIVYARRTARAYSPSALVQNLARPGAPPDGSPSSTDKMKMAAWPASVTCHGRSG